jgi:hypothetical protein
VVSWDLGIAYGLEYRFNLLGGIIVGYSYRLFCDILSFNHCSGSNCSFISYFLLLRWIGERSPEKHSRLLLSVSINVIRTTAAATTTTTDPECQEPNSLLVARCPCSRPSGRCIKRHNSGSHKRGQSEIKVRAKGGASQVCRVRLQREKTNNRPASAAATGGSLLTDKSKRTNV